MRTYDFTPLYRSAVGFDRLANLLETAARTSQDGGYPPYNIETTGENAYRIEIAVAGFSPDELNIEVKENLLTVTGRKTANDDAEAQKTYLHRGLAERDFERRFQLADYVVVSEADFAEARTAGSAQAPPHRDRRRPAPDRGQGPDQDGRQGGLIRLRTEHYGRAAFAPPFFYAGFWAARCAKAATTCS